MSDRRLVFALLFAARTAIAVQFQSVGATGPFLIAALGIDFAVLGMLIGCHLLPGVALAWPGGLLGDRIGAKRLAFGALALMVAGGSLTAAGSAEALFAGRLIGGSGAVVLNVVLSRMMADWFAPGELVAAMGGLVASWPLGIALGLAVLPGLASSLGWPAAMAAATLPALVCLVLLGALYRDPSGGPPRPGPAGAAPDGRAHDRPLGRVLVAGCAWGAYNAAFVVFVTAMPDVLVAAGGYAVADAAAVASLFGWATLVAAPLGGILWQRLSGGPGASAACLCATAAAALVVALTADVGIAFAILVVAIGLPAGAMMAMPARALPPDRRSGGMGAFFTVFYLAMAVLPALAGLVRERSGDAASALIVGAALLVAAAFAVMRFAASERPA